MALDIERNLDEGGREGLAVAGGSKGLPPRVPKLVALAARPGRVASRVRTRAAAPNDCPAGPPKFGLKYAQIWTFGTQSWTGFPGAYITCPLSRRSRGGQSVGKVFKTLRGLENRHSGCRKVWRRVKTLRPCHSPLKSQGQTLKSATLGQGFGRLTGFWSSNTQTLDRAHYHIRKSKYATFGQTSGAAARVLSRVYTVPVYLLVPLYYYTCWAHTLTNNTNQETALCRSSVRKV